MIEWNQLGRLLVLLGLGIALVGGVLFLVGKLPWLGRLPGDIIIRREGGWSCFFPLATSIIISVLLTVVLNIIVRLFKN